MKRDVCRPAKFCMYSSHSYLLKSTLNEQNVCIIFKKNHHLSKCRTMLHFVGQLATLFTSVTNIPTFLKSLFLLDNLLFLWHFYFNYVVEQKQVFLEISFYFSIFSKTLSFLLFIGEELEWLLMTLKFTLCLHLVGRSSSILLLQNYAMRQRTNLLKFEENIGHENGSLWTTCLRPLTWMLSGYLL